MFVSFRVVISFITILAFIVLARSLKGWRHALGLPVWLLLGLTLYATWTFPIWTQAGWERARQERLQEKQRIAMPDEQSPNNTSSPKGEKNP
jgi:hypothetical protein